MKFTICAVTAPDQPSLFITTCHIDCYVRVADKHFTAFLREISKKGFYSVLVYISESGELHYSEILKAARSVRVVESSWQINSVLRTLTSLRLLEQRVITTQIPIRTLYSISKSGRAVLQLLKQLENEIR